MRNQLTHWFDLDGVPYTVRFSRLFVRRLADGLTVFEAAYERSLDDSVVLRGLRVFAPEGELAVSSASPWGVFFSDARLFLDEVALHVVGLPDGAELRWDGGTLRAQDGTATILLRDGETPSAVDAADKATEIVDEWMGRCPTVVNRWQDVTRFCWWVLGVNTLRLHREDGEMFPVVPSKIGYVGLWQWDAYFMALGLRHGAPELAQEQMRIALKYQAPDGQLPDVVHEEGILASSEDLAEIDLINLQELASPSLASERVPLTKPPLTALTLSMLEETISGIVDEHLDAVLRAQLWWYTHSLHNGAPAYLHPYSSGLDDSPVFDHEAILESPDLTSYLIRADELLAGWLEQRGRTEEAAEARARADASLERLLGRWDSAREMFAAVGEQGNMVPSETILSLMPLLISDLPPEYVDRLVAAIQDEQRFNLPKILPTVARRDPDFSETRMWRGPVWINTNWLVAQGLRQHGHVRLAEAIEESSLSLVEQSGACEYFNPVDGTKPFKAVTNFGWTSALIIDMAVAATHS